VLRVDVVDCETDGDNGETVDCVCGGSPLARLTHPHLGYQKGIPR
jgi:hypothetical protein